LHYNSLEGTGTTADGIWNSTLEHFRKSVASTRPVPAGVSASSVSAALGMSLLRKVLEILAARKGFSGDREKLSALRQAAQTAAEDIMHFAEADITAYRAYVEARRLRPDDTETAQLLRRVVDVPLEAARSTLSALDLCVDAASLATGAIVADLGTAALLLAGAVRALLLCVRANLRMLPDPAVAHECGEMEERASRQLDVVLRQVNTGNGPA